MSERKNFLASKRWEKAAALKKTRSEKANKGWENAGVKKETFQRKNLLLILVCRV